MACFYEFYGNYNFPVLEWSCTTPKFKKVVYWKLASNKSILVLKELDFETIRCINFYACLSTFTYQRLSNNSINYYVNHADGFSIYDQDWDLV